MIRFFVYDLKITIVSLMAIVIALFILGVILLFVYSKKYRKSIAVTASILLFNIKIMGTSFDNFQFIIAVSLLLAALILFGADISLIVYISKLKKPKAAINEVKVDQPVINEPVNQVEAILSSENPNNEPNAAPIAAATTAIPITSTTITTIETEEVEFNKEFLAKYIAARINGIEVKNRSNYTNPAKNNKKGLLLPDSYCKNINGKNKCLGLLYNPDENNMYFIFRLTKKAYDALESEGYNLTYSPFPCATEKMTSFKYVITGKGDFVNKALKAVEIVFNNIE